MRIALFISIIIFLSSCAQLSRLDTGRTVGKGNFELGGFISLYGTNETSGLGPVGLPMFGGQLSYGLLNKVDLNLSVNSGGNLYFNPKFQIVGDQESPLAISLLPGIDVQIGNISGTEGNVIFRPHISAIVSFHVDEWSAFLEPKYIYQDVTSSHFVGATVGLEYDLNRRTAFSLGYSFFPVLESDFARSASLYNIGFGVMRRIN